MEIYETVRLLTPQGPGVRLLKLHLHASPNRTTSHEIHGTLTSHPISAAPPYQALSYAWGQKSKSHPIMLNGKETFIAQVLHEGLTRLLQESENSDGKESKYLWIDSLCINQQDTSEKSEQVSRMRDIYAQAERVIVWLGEADEHTSLAFETLKLFAANDGTEDGRRTSADLATSRTSRRAAVETFIQRQWFSRVWVIQEVVVSRGATVHCGPLTMDWEDVNKGLQRVSGSGFIPFSDQVNKVTSIGIWRDKFHMQRDSAVRAEDLDMRLIMMDEAAKRASDLRDKIYALRGLASDKFAAGIIVNYRDTIEKVFTDSTKHLLQMRKDLRILERVRQRGKNPSLKLPSWVPDWDLPDPGGVMNRYYRFSLTKRFCASGREFYRIIVPAEGDVIQVFGIHIDKVQCIYDIRSLLKDSVTGGLYINEIRLRDLAKRLELPETYGPTKEESWIALFRTLTADRSPLSSRINDEYRIKNFGHVEVLVTVGQGAGAKVSEAAWARVSSLLGSIVDGKVFYITENGYLGFTEQLCQEGDDVYVFCGGEVPFVVRSHGERCFAFHGESYVHGVMDGEAMGWKHKQIEQISLQ